MAQHKIKIEGVADFSKITKEVDGLTKTIQKSIGKEGFKIIDEKALGHVKKETQAVFSKLTDQVKRLKKEAQELDKIFAASTNTQKKQEEIGKRRLEVAKQLIGAERQMFSLRRSQQILDNGFNPPEPDNKGKFGSLAKRQIGGGIRGVANQLPGVSEAYGVGEAGISAGKSAATMGMGAGAIAGIAALGVAAAAAAVVITRAAAGFETFKQAIPNLLTLSGMGLQAMRSGSAVDTGQSLGFDKMQVMDFQKQAGASFGRTGAKGENNRLSNIMLAGRGLGMDPSAIMGAGNSLRAVGGVETAQKQIGQILEKAFTSGMDKTQASAYLASATELLTELNQTGAANTDKLLSTFASMVGKGNMSPEMAARTMGGINSAITGSSGENNAFFQGAAARAGLGGGSLLGTQFAVRQGLTGVDMGALQKQVGDTRAGAMGIQAIQEMGLNDKNYTKKFAQSILSEFTERRIDTGSKEGRAAALGLVGQTFGVKDAASAARILGVLEKIATTTGDSSETDKKLLSDLTKNPEEAWREKVLGGLDRMALATESVQAFAKNQQFDLGEQVAPYFNKLTEALGHLDATIAGTMGGPTKGLGDQIWDGLKDAFQMLIVDLPAAIGKAFNGALGMDERGVIGKGEDLGRSAINGVSNLLGFGDAVDPEGDTKKMLKAREAQRNSISGMTGSTPTGPSVSSSGTMNNDAGAGTTYHDLVTEQKKTNHILEKLVKPGQAPRAGREALR